MMYAGALTIALIVPPMAAAAILSRGEPVGLTPMIRAGTLT